MKLTYVASFSFGPVTRTSHHKYLTAAAAVKDGKPYANPTFSASRARAVLPACRVDFLFHRPTKPDTLSAMSKLYITGIDHEGRKLVGGAWAFFQQEGFPLELLHLELQRRGHRVDWLEGMADASTTNNCPALVAHLSSFLPADDLTALKMRFVALFRDGTGYEEFLQHKRAGAVPTT